MEKTKFGGERVTSTPDASNVTPSASETSKKQLPNRV
jgi:hypothetical protein